MRAVSLAGPRGVDKRPHMCLDAACGTYGTGSTLVRGKGTGMIVQFRPQRPFGRRAFLAGALSVSSASLLAACGGGGGGAAAPTAAAGPATAAPVTKPATAPPAQAAPASTATPA